MKQKVGTVSDETVGSRSLIGSFESKLIIIMTSTLVNDQAVNESQRVG